MKLLTPKQIQDFKNLKEILKEFNKVNGTNFEAKRYGDDYRVREIAQSSYHVWEKIVLELYRKNWCVCREYDNQTIVCQLSKMAEKV